MSESRDELALAVVLWDGANEDGCAFCQGEWRGGDQQGVPPFVLHTAKCPVVLHRLELIDALVKLDPYRESPEGERLTELANAQQRYEAARFGPTLERE